VGRRFLPMISISTRSRSAFQLTFMQPSGTEREPYFAALVTSSCKINASEMASFGGSINGVPMHTMRDDLLVLLKQFNEAGSEEVICNIAAWQNSNANGPFLTVELSPRYVPKKPETTAVRKKSSTLHAFF
jgi:hypothetical protein